MKYRKMGNTGLKVSEIRLGSWFTYGTAAEQKAADACVAKAFECGINFFDTANAYNCGEGEKAVGAALRSYTRSDYVLSTKVFFPMGDGVNDRRWLILHLQDKTCGRRKCHIVFLYDIARPAIPFAANTCT